MAGASVCIDQLFREARTHSAWLDKPVSDDTLRDLYDALRWGTDQRKRLAGSVRLHPLIEVTARRNSSLQGAYLILAARALGLDCGPMSGFDNSKLDEEFFGAGKECDGCEQEFFPAGHVKSSFLCNLGYGDRTKLFPRGPRLEFNEACTLM